MASPVSYHWGQFKIYVSHKKEKISNQAAVGQTNLPTDQTTDLPTFVTTCRVAWI